MLARFRENHIAQGESVDASRSACLWCRGSQWPYVSEALIDRP